MFFLPTLPELNSSYIVGSFFWKRRSTLPQNNSRLYFNRGARFFFSLYSSFGTCSEDYAFIYFSIVLGKYKAI